MLPIIGVYVSAVFLSGLASVLAIIFGIIARKKIKAQPSALQGKGLALAGIISGTIWISLNIIGILIIVIYFLPNFLTR